MQELEKILEELEKYTFSAEVYDDDFNGETITNLICLGDVREVLEEHMNDGWIPVERELPEDDIEVLVTYTDIDDDNYTHITITIYGYAYLGGNKLDFKEWRSPFEYFKSNYKVIAWQPLPEPYRTERNEEK